MLIQKDLDEIEQIIKDTVKEEIKHLPNKDEFYGKMDELMGEVKAVRESQELHSGTHTEISDRIENLEKVLKSS